MTWPAAEHNARRNTFGVRWCMVSQPHSRSRSAARREIALSGALWQRMRCQERMSASPSMGSTVASTGQCGVGEGRTSASRTDCTPWTKIWSMAVALSLPLVDVKCVGVHGRKAAR